MSPAPYPPGIAAVGRDDYELVVVDDGSTDATGRIADEYARAHPARIRVVHQANGGLPAARNAAIAAGRGELFALMSCGMAGIAGTVMALYAGILGPVIPDALGTILVASVVSTPAALAVSALMVPFGPGEALASRLHVPDPPVSASVIEPSDSTSLSASVSVVPKPALVPNDASTNCSTG